MKILFYLPAVTPWWFEIIITPMLRALHGEAELHVMVPPLWRNTGIDIVHVEPLADLPAINWHIVTTDDPWQFRMEGASVDGLLELVRSIDPDITIARSADAATPALFPGVVRHIMEPGAQPLHTPHRWFVLDERPFHHGVMPASVAAQADRAARHMAPFWDAIDAEYARISPAALRARLDLPADRPILAVPLQYEHEENFYGVGSPLQRGPDLVRILLKYLDERIVLAITDHPLNALYLNRTELHRIAAEYPDRVRLYPVEKDRPSTTHLLAPVADGIVIDRSKCISLATFFGTPIVHVGDSVMADWLNATPVEALTADALANRSLPAPDRETARRWFGWHFGMRLTNFSKVTFQTLQDRVFDRTPEAETHEMLTFLEPWLEAAVTVARQSISDIIETGKDGKLAA